jgi:uncharacterized membrane-anchored protein
MQIDAIGGFRSGRFCFLIFTVFCFVLLTSYGKASELIELNQSRIRIEQNANWRFVSAVEARPLVSEVSTCRHPIAELQGLIQVRIPDGSELINVPIYYFQTGYISMPHNLNIDTNEVLNRVQFHASRNKLPVPRRWISTPYFNYSKESLVWGFQFEEALSGFSGIHHILIPGRMGFMLLNIPIFFKHNFDVDVVINELIQGTSFSEGFQYSDFQIDSDHRSLVDIAQIIAGVPDLKSERFSIINYWKIGFFLILGIFALGIPELFKKYRKKGKSSGT